MWMHMEKNKTNNTQFKLLYDSNWQILTKNKYFFCSTNDKQMRPFVCVQSKREKKTTQEQRAECWEHNFSMHIIFNFHSSA